MSSKNKEQNKKDVQNWRGKTKQRIINSLGGKCCDCGYSRCKEALELHHLEPNHKEFAFSEAISNGAGKIKLFPELEKCILLCAICHREFHAGIRALPENPVRFNPILYVD